MKPRCFLALGRAIENYLGKKRREKKNHKYTNIYIESEFYYSFWILLYKYKCVPIIESPKLTFELSRPVDNYIL